MNQRLTVQHKERLRRALQQASQLNLSQVKELPNSNDLFKLRMQAITNVIQDKKPQIKLQEKGTREYLKYFRVNPIIKKQEKVNYMEEYKEFFQKSQVSSRLRKQITQDKKLSEQQIPQLPQKQQKPQQIIQIKEDKSNQLFEKPQPTQSFSQNLFKSQPQNNISAEKQDKKIPNLSLFTNNGPQNSNPINKAEPTAFNPFLFEKKAQPFNIFMNNSPKKQLQIMSKLPEEKLFQPPSQTTSAFSSHLFSIKAPEVLIPQKNEQKEKQSVEPMPKINLFSNTQGKSLFLSKIPEQNVVEKKQQPINIFNKQPLFMEAQKIMAIEVPESLNKKEEKPIENIQVIEQKEKDKEEVKEKQQSIQMKQEKPSISLFAVHKKEQQEEVNIFQNKKEDTIFKNAQKEKIDEPKEENSSPSKLFTSPEKPLPQIFNPLPTQNLSNNLFKNNESTFGSSGNSGNSGNMFATNNNNTGNMFGSNMFSSSKNPFESKKPETLGNSGQPSNIFATSGNTNMFGGSGNNGNSGTMFGGSGNTGTMFGNPGNSTPENKNIFGQSIGQPMFTKNDQGQEGEDNQEGDGLYQTEEDAVDPSKSTGTYNYDKSDIFFKEAVSKLRKGNADLIENVTVSIEKVGGSENKVIYVRMPNKCIYFYGTILPETTQITVIKEGIYKNVHVKKIIGEKDNKKYLESVKIQFKEEKHGKSFVDASK